MRLGKRSSECELANSARNAPGRSRLATTYTGTRTAGLVEMATAFQTLMSRFPRSSLKPQRAQLGCMPRRMHHYSVYRLIAATLLFALPSIVSAQPSYPARPISVVVPFAAGGPTDVLARVLGQHMGETL